MLLTFRRCTFCCIHHCWTKRPGYPLRERLQDFIDCCLYIVYMYQWQNQHALPLMPGWILVPSDPWRWQEKLLCSVGTALPSKLCAALHGQSNVGSMCDLQAMRKFGFASFGVVCGLWLWYFLIILTYDPWWKFYQELTVTMVQVPEGMAM